MPGLEDLYREIILDHYRSPRNKGELPSPPAVKAEGFNPLCGDEIIVYLIVSSGGVVEDIKISGQGCSISQSSASMMSSSVKGKATSEARDLVKTFKRLMSIHEHEIAATGDSASGIATTSASAAYIHDDEADEEAVDLSKLGDLAALQGVVKFPVRIKCATLSWNTLLQALDEAEAST